MGLFQSISSMVVKHATRLSIRATKKAPDILFVGGIVTIIGGTVSAVMATSKADETMDEFKKNIDRIHETIELATQKGDVEKYYPVKQQQEDYKVVYGHMIVTMAKIYLPTVLLEVAGIFMLCKSHQILNKRNAGLAAAYAALAKQFNDYRKRVKDRYGEQEENDIYNGYVTTTYVEKETAENGVTTEVEKKKQTYCPSSPFAFLISREDNPWGFRDPYMILNEIDLVVRSLNMKLSARNAMNPKMAFLNMNEIAEAFNEAQRTEWATFVKYSDKNDVGCSLNVGICSENANIEGTPEWKFVNKMIDGIWLVPNIDGNICDDLDTQYRIAGIKDMAFHHKQKER